MFVGQCYSPWKSRRNLTIISFGAPSPFLRSVGEWRPGRAVEEVGEEGPIDVVKTPEEIRATPYKLPPSFEWYDIDIMNDTEVGSIRAFLWLGGGAVHAALGELRRGRPGHVPFCLQHQDVAMVRIWVRK